MYTYTYTYKHIQIALDVADVFPYLLYIHSYTYTHGPMFVLLCEHTVYTTGVVKFESKRNFQKNI